MKQSISFFVFTILILCGLLWSTSPARAHCDTMEGPVVQDAQKALSNGDVTPVLKWVEAADESEIRHVFDYGLKVRALGPDARELADTYFFETLVRVHRASEGAPFTGLKPAGSVEPPIAAADKALETGAVAPLANQVAQEIREAIEKRFADVVEKKAHAEHNVEAGREYVHAYVEYVHFVENFHNLITRGAAHGESESAPTGHQH